MKACLDGWCRPSIAVDEWKIAYHKNFHVCTEIYVKQDLCSFDEYITSNYLENISDVRFLRLKM